jgi:hypothetical protein
MMILKDQTPTYDQALAALKAGDREVLSRALFAFDIDDAYYVERVREVVRALLTRPDLSPKQIIGIGHALHGLGRLPLCTPGLDVHLSLIDRVENDVTSYELYITSDFLSTQSGSIEGSGFDRNSFSGPTFRVDSGSREYDGFSASTENWPDVFSEMAYAELEVTDLSDGSLLDLEHPDGSEFWEWIANHE